MKLTIGRFVTYRVRHDDQMEMLHNGAKELPAIVVSVHSDICANLQVFTDGPQRHTSIWKTSVMLGGEPGNWYWPERV